MIIFHEAIITCILKKNINYVDAQEVISNHINNGMINDKFLSNLHKGKGFKFYNFNSFYPIEKDGIYKKGSIYVFRIRSIDLEILNRIVKAIKNVDIGYFNVIAVEKRKIKNNFISQLYTVTPVVVTVENRNWVNSDDMEVFKNRLHNNLVHKYEKYFNKKVNTKTTEIFFEGMQILNNPAIVMNYKGGKILGHKLKLFIKEDSTSQKLAEIALACGLGEKNSIGYGFCFKY